MRSHTWGRSEFRTVTSCGLGSSKGFFTHSSDGWCWLLARSSVEAVGPNTYTVSLHMVPWLSHSMVAGFHQIEIGNKFLFFFLEYKRALPHHLTVVLFYFLILYMSTSFPICVPLIFLSCLIVFINTLHTMMKRSGDGGQGCLVPDFNEITSKLSPFRMMFSVGL